MGLFFSGYVSDPGGHLTLRPPSELLNAELAAQQYVDYLRGMLVLSPTELSMAVYTVSCAAHLPQPSESGSTRFWELLDEATALAATRPALPPLAFAFPPPPPPRRPPPTPQPAPSSPPLPAPSPPAALTLYIGCFPDDTAAPILSETLLAANRTNSPDRCVAAAAAAGSTAVFIGLRRSQCVGAGALPAAFLLSRQADELCATACPGAPGQRCGGGAPNGTVALFSVYRIRQPAAAPQQGASPGPAASVPRPPPSPSARPSARGAGRRSSRRLL